MADETSPKSEPEIVAPAAVPPSREPRRDPGVIEGEATEIHQAPPAEPTAEAEDEEPATEERATEAPTNEEPAIEETAAGPPADAPAPEIRLRPPRAGLPFVAGALGALFGAALALAAASLVDPRAGALDAANRRLGALERGAEGQSVANANFDQRLAALEKSAANPDFERRLGALEKSAAGLAKAAAGESQAAEAALAEARSARADAAKALALAAATGPSAPPVQNGAPAAFDAGALEARIAKLEDEWAALQPSGAGLEALDDRLAKVESALAAPKSEARVAAAEVAPDRDGAAEAILAFSLDQRLNAGAPFAAELAALARLGADGGRLSALRPFADSGAPTPAALAASFAKIAPGLAAAAAPPSDEGVIDRLLDHLRKLVRVRRVGEAAGEDAEAVAPRIAAALARGDLAAALDAYKGLPDAARQAGRDWAETAAARQAAGAAAEGLRADAVARLAAARN